MSRRWVLGILLGAAIGARGSAQEPPGVTLKDGQSEISAGDGLLWKEGDADVAFLTGQIRVRRPDFEMTAARAMVWKKTGSTHPVDEIYAEGNVILKRGGQELRAERVYFDIARDRAVIVDFRAKETSAKFSQSFYLKAREARMTLGHLVAEDLSITTCSYGIPHYHVEAGRAEVTGRQLRPRRPDGWDPWPFVDYDIDFGSIYPRLGDAPFFFLPGFSLGPWVRDFPIRSISGGRSSRFGTYVYTEMGIKIRKDVEGHSPRTWGELTGEVDWREFRGGGYGLDLRYTWDGYEGYTDTYFLHDKGRENDVSFDTKFAPLKREERGRVHSFHRHDLDANWRYELEAHYLSDRDLREEFFEKEFKEEKEPETAAYVRWVDDHWGGFVLERHRLNDFQTQNEYLPRADLSIFQEPILGGWTDHLLLTERLDVAHVRRRWDKDLHLESASTWRTDLLSELSSPWDLEVLQISPFVQQRLTVYDDDLEGETEFRSIWTAGGRIVAQLHATDPELMWDLVGLRGLRHVIELEARYANAVDTTLETAEVFPFEEVDQLDEFEEVAFELRQRFLTRDAHGKPFEFLNVVGTVEYYPDSARDTTFANVNTYQAPFDWVSLAPDRSGSFERRHWSNIHYGFEFRPRDFIRMFGAGEYNPVTRHEEVRELAAVAEPVKGISAAVSQTFVRGLTDAWTFEVAWSMSEKWAASASVQYDFRADEYLEQSIVVSRDCHDFLIQGVLEHDFGRDERRVYVTFVPTFLGKSGLRRSKLAKAGAEMLK